MNLLNPQQTAAVTSEASRIVVPAVPGSGKSAVLIARVEHRISLGVEPQTIYCITYSQAGAKVMSDRLRDRGITVGFVGTRHGLLYRILQRFGQRIGYRAGGVTLVTETDAELLLLDAAKLVGWKGSVTKLLEGKDPLAALAHKEHRQRLRRSNAVTYDLVLEEGLRILTQLPVDEFRVGDLLIDEAQDNSRIDWRIDSAISANSTFWVLDQDQSVFGFRGAYPEGVMSIVNEPGCELHKLELNYRSGREICMAATTLIRHNVHRIDKAVISASGHGCCISVQGFDDGLQELRATVAMVAGHPSDIPLSEIAVIARTNAIASDFREALKAAGVPVAEAKRRETPPDWSAALDVLSLWQDPRNDMLAEKVLKRMIGAKLGKAKELALRDGHWLSVAGRDVGALPSIIDNNLIEHVPANLAQWRIGIETVEAIRQRIKLLPQPHPTLSDLVHDMWSGGDGDESETEGVTVSTAHSVKGKEFDCVFIVAAEEGVFPSLRKDSDPEEERRLFYVSMTRARTELHISYASKRQTQWGGAVAAAASRFISESGF